MAASKKENPRRRTPGISEARAVGTQLEPHPRADVHEWSVPAREGFTVRISERGNIILEQRWPDPQQVVLHPDEATELCPILHQAVKTTRGGSR